MTTLLVLRERIKKLYAAHSFAAEHLIRGAICLVVFFLIYFKAGYMERLHFIAVPVFLTLVGAFVPYGLVSALAAAYLLVNLSAVSIEAGIVTMAFIVLIFCVYFVFQPGDGIIIVLVAAACGLNIPLVAAMAIGLAGSIYSVIPLTAGVVIYYTVDFVADNFATLSSSGTLSSLERLMQMISGVFGYRNMWMMATVMVITMLCVYIIRRLAVDHAWRIAIITGAVLNVFLMIAGTFMFNLDFSFFMIFANTFLAAVTGITLEFFLFHQDYSRTEYVQFEDDDYYYYVKAVPKVAVTQPEVTVQTISEQNKEYGAGGEELFRVRPDLAGNSQLFTSGKDLERTQSLFSTTVPEGKEDIETGNMGDTDDFMKNPGNGE